MCINQDFFFSDRVLLLSQCCILVTDFFFCLAYSTNIIYVASNHFVWRLIPVSIATQIQQLLQDKQFELALQLAVSTEKSFGLQ